MLERVLFAGGGTGGHVYLAVSIREELRQSNPDCQYLFVGTERGMESQILPPLDFPLSTIEIGGLKNVGVLKTLETMLQIPLSLLQSWRIVRDFRPSIIVGLGGYSSGPVVLAGRLTGFPSILIEPNVVPGLTNRLAGRLVGGAAVAFEETSVYYGKKAHLTGIPIRRGFHEIEPKERYQLPLNVLIFGGSRGSADINRLICQALPLLDPAKFKVRHQTGPADLENVRRSYTEADFPAQVTPYIEDMPEHFQWADLIISRSGASTVAEITAAGRPAILIPFPHAADDHQTKNALALKKRGAALLLKQAETTGADLAGQLLEFARQPEGLATMATASHSLAQSESVHKIIDLMNKTASEQQ